MFKDWNEVPEWAREYVETAVERELISGYPDGTLRFNEPLHRGEYIVGQAKVAKRAEELIEADRQEMLLRIANAVVEINSSEGVGSGVVLSDGRILTNAHVVGNDAEVIVKWSSPLVSTDVAEFAGRYPVVKKNDTIDLALIHAPPVEDIAGYVEFNEEWVDTNFRTTARRFFGSTLYTQGSPEGLSGALSRGMFSGIHYYGSFFLTYSGSINPGNSGGGIYDLSGKLVSIAVAKPKNALVDGIGFGVVPLFVHRFLTD